MADALQDLIELLDLEPIEVNIFRGCQPDEDRQRVFGGQVAGQALVAAARTVDEPGRHVHSLHAYFLRPGDPSVPILYEVDRIRDGRSFTTRRVVAIQHGRPIFNLQASFHDTEPGLDHQIEAPRRARPRVAADLPRAARALPEQVGDWYRPAASDRHPVRATRPCASNRASSPTASSSGCGPTGALPDDPVLHACIVTYASDMTLLDTALRRSACRRSQDH